MYGNERAVQDATDELPTLRRLKTYKFYKEGNLECSGDGNRWRQSYSSKPTSNEKKFYFGQREFLRHYRWK